MNEIILSIIDKYKFGDDDIIFQTHATNPLLDKNDIKAALDVVLLDNMTIMSVTSYNKRLWTMEMEPVNHERNKLIQTQDMKPLMEENSCFYIFKVGDMIRNRNRIGTNIHFCEINYISALDIDTEDDFKIIEAVYRFNSDNINIIKKVHKDEEVYNNLKKIHLSNIRIKRGQTVLITAPYMMSNIEAFVRYYNEIGVEVLVADVGERLGKDELLEYSGRYNVALTGDDEFNEEVLERAKGLRGICKWGTGIDSINREWCLRNGVRVLNTPNAFSEPVAQSIVSAILCFLRGTMESTNMMKYSDKWVKRPCRVMEEVTIGIIGLGNIGKRLLKILGTMTKNVVGCDLVRMDVDIEQMSKDELLSKSDIVCVCCDYREGNYHLIGQKELEMMPRGGYLINMARGKLVDLEAVETMLLGGYLGGCALDVFEDEPLSENSVLRRLDNVILSSHNSNSSPKYWMDVHINTVRNSLSILGE